jgi:sulfur-oxidizing protein SoxX
MKRNTAIAASAALAAAVAGCTTMAPPPDYDKLTHEIIQSSFHDRGIAKTERLTQDSMQLACSADKPPSADVARQIESAAQASVKWPSDGVFLGDWREGEKLAQSGRGMTWSDRSAAPSANGGSCYNCHQISKAEISYGTIGPSLYNYGKLHGVRDPASPESAAVVRYTWGKLWNSKGNSACSNMPRFGFQGLLDEQQIRNLMALLLDPKSPVNQ